MALCYGPDTCRDMHDFDFYVEYLGCGKFSKFFNLKRTNVKWWFNDIIINVRTESLACLVAHMKTSIPSLAKCIISWLLCFIRDTLAKSPKQPHSVEFHDIWWHEEPFAYSAASHLCLVSQSKKAPRVPQGLGERWPPPTSQHLARDRATEVRLLQVECPKRLSFHSILPWRP